jgi:hypothetical protein
MPKHGPPLAWQRSTHEPRAVFHDPAARLVIYEGLLHVYAPHSCHWGPMHGWEAIVVLKGLGIDEQLARQAVHELRNVYSERG